MSENHHAPASTPLPFSAADMGGFREADTQAGKAIVVLMAGIFALGIVIYSIVLYTL